MARQVTRAPLVASEAQRKVVDLLKSQQPRINIGALIITYTILGVPYYVLV